MVEKFGKIHGILRVLHVVSGLGYGGVESMLMQLYRNIDRTRIQFDFVTHTDREDYHEDIEKMGGRIFYIKSLGQSNFITYIYMLYKLIRTNGPYHVVHAHTAYQSGVVVLAARLAGIKYRICHSHSSRIYGKIQRALLPLWRFLMRVNSTSLLACSYEAGQNLYGNEPFDYFPNAIDLYPYMELNESDRANIRAEFNLDPNTFLLGHVGRFEPVKNHNFFIGYCQQLLVSGVDFKLVLVGDGPLRQDIERAFAEAGIQESVLFTGIRKDIPKFMYALDLFMLPSISEGFPLTVVEAQAARTPSLVSTGVPSQIDLGIGLVKFLNIEDRNKWVSESILVARTKSQSKSISEVNLAFNKAGLDIIGSCDKLYKLYNERQRSQVLEN